MKEEWEKYFSIHSAYQDDKRKHILLYMIFTKDRGRGKSDIKHVSTHGSHAMAVAYARSYVNQWDKALIGG